MAAIKYTKVYTKEKYAKIKAAQKICNRELKIAMNDKNQIADRKNEKNQIAYWRIAKAMSKYNKVLVRLGLNPIPTK